MENILHYGPADVIAVSSSRVSSKSGQVIYLFRLRSTQLFILNWRINRVPSIGIPRNRLAKHDYSLLRPTHARYFLARILARKSHVSDVRMYSVLGESESMSVSASWNASYKVKPKFDGDAASAGSQVTLCVIPYLMQTPIAVRVHLAQTATLLNLFTFSFSGRVHIGLVLLL